jgi:hypothetical protein
MLTSLVPLCSINRHNTVWSRPAALSVKLVGEYIYFKTNQNEVLSDSEFDTENGRSCFLDSVIYHRIEKSTNVHWENTQNYKGQKENF